MTRFERYLFRSLLIATLYSTAGLTVTIWLTQSLRLVEIVVETGAPLKLFFWLLALTVPTFLGIVLPIALVGAVIFTYNRMTMDSEMVVMRAAGMGPFRLAGPAMALAVLVMGVVYVLNIWVTPAAHRELVRLERAVRSDYSQLLLREGVFNDIADRLSVYVRERDHEGNLHGILIHDARVPDKVVTIIGESAVMVPDEAGARFIVYTGLRQEKDRGKPRLSELYFERYAISLKLSVSGGPVGERWADARERGTFDLLNASPEGMRDPRQFHQLVAELHHRLSSPLLSLAFTMVALACLLSGEFNRRGQSSRIAVAILVVVLLQATALGLTSVTVRLPAFLGLMYLMPLAALFPAAWVLAQGAQSKRRALPAAASSAMAPSGVA